MDSLKNFKPPNNMEEFEKSVISLLEYKADFRELMELENNSGQLTNLRNKSRAARWFQGLKETQ